VEEGRSLRHRTQEMGWRPALAVLLIWMASAALLLAQLGPATPQTPKCTVTGTATAGTLRLPGVAITATSPEGGNPLTTSTQLDGRFSLEVPGPGRYQMTGELSAFTPVT
jgi:hypothetical protein